MRLVRGAAAAVVGVALLAGCSDGATANETLPSASTTGSAEPSPTLPPLGPADLPMPADARVKTPDGAAAALGYYLALLTHQAGVSGQPLRDLSRECDFCSFIAARYDDDAAAGNVYNGGVLTVDSMSEPSLNGEVAEFSFTVSQSAIEIVGPNGSPVDGRGQDALSGLNAGARMTWSQQGRVWLMNQLIINNS